MKKQRSPRSVLRWFGVLAVLLALTGQAVADKVDDLIRRLGDSDNKVRLSAALNLGKLGDKRAIMPLVGALKDSDKTVRGVAAAALGKLIDQTVPADVRKKAIDALESTAKNDGDAFVRSQAQKSFDAVKGLRGGSSPTPPGVVDLGGKKVYVEIGPFTDSSGQNLAPVARRVVEKHMGKDFAVRWPTGKSPTGADLSKAGVKGYYVDGTVNKIEVKKSGGLTTVKCYISMLAATYPEKSAFAFVNNKKAEVDAAGNSDKDIAEATAFCVEAQIEALTKSDLMPAIKAKGL